MAKNVIFKNLETSVQFLIIQGGNMQFLIIEELIRTLFDE